MNVLSLNVHGVTVTLRSDRQEFIQFCGRVFDYFLADKAESLPALECEIAFSRGTLHAVGLPCRLATELWIGESQLVTDDPCGLRLRVTADRGDGRLEITGEFHESIKHWVRKLVRGPTHATYQVYTEIMQAGLRLPLFYLLRKWKGLTVFHAGGVSRSGRALLFFGFSGGAKSTLVQYFVRAHRFRFMGDNYLLVNREGNEALAFPETVRLSRFAAELLNIDLSGKRPVHGRYLLDVRRDDVELSAQPEAVFFIGLSKNLILEPVPAGEMAAKIHAMHTFTGETDEFHYPGLLDPFVFKATRESTTASVLERLCKGCPCFLLSIPITSHIEEGYKAVHRTIQSTLRR